MIFRIKKLPDELERFASRLLEVAEELRCDYALYETSGKLEQIAHRLGHWSVILTLNEERDETD